jgi:Holliday junction DNA helicase RuvA
MIGRLWGVVAEVGEEEALIDVAGVGYVVRCGSRTLGRLPAVGQPMTLHIESQFGEQTGLTLYGFLDRNERRAFVMLKTIQGVGPKAALAVLDVLPPSELSAAAQRGDQAAVSRAQGVGPKLALRIVTELKDKPIGDGLIVHAAASPPTPAKPSATGEAVAALMGLGVAEPAARRVVEQAALRLGDEAEAPALIKAALQELGR